MTRQIRSAKLDTRTARERLPVGSTIHYADLGVGGADVGYRKGKTSGKWLLRCYAGAKRYVVETIGIADDRADADGTVVLNFRQAQALARQLHEQHARRDQGLPAGSGPYTVADALGDYLAHQDATGGRTARDSRVRAAALILPHLGPIETSKLTTARLRAWLDSLATAPARLRTRKGERQKYATFDPSNPEDVRRRRASANRTLTILKAALNFAWREGRVVDDHAWRRVKPFRGAEAARARYLQVDEARRLLNACNPDFRDLVEAALQTGARYSELAALQVADYNADAATIHVRASKSGKTRHIVLTDEGRYLFGRLCAGRSPSEPMLLRAGAGRWLKGFHVRPMHAAVERAKLGDDVSFHVLRYTWASLAVMNGVPLMVVADNLGHADTRMVERHYGHLAPSYKADAIRAGAPRFGTLQETNVAALPGSRHDAR